MADLNKIKQEAIDLEIDFSASGAAFDLDKRSGGIGGTFANNPAGLEAADEWLSKYRAFVEASDVDRSK